jgi:hypothetical protein
MEDHAGTAYSSDFFFRGARFFAGVSGATADASSTTAVFFR